MKIKKVKYFSIRFLVWIIICSAPIILILFITFLIKYLGKL